MMSSVVTDDNIYQDVPTKIYFNNDVFASKKLGIENNKEVFKNDTIQKGALLLNINNRKFNNLNDIKRYLIDIEKDEVNIDVFVPHPNDSIVGKRYGYIIDKNKLNFQSLNELNSAVIVSYILKGGSSEMAGLQVGDIITKVNGNDFENAIAAFELTINNSATQSVYFTILRNGKFTNIKVKLSTIKLSFNVLFTYLVGLFLILISIFIAYNRFYIFQGRIVAFTLLMLGLFLAFLPHSTYNYNMDLFYVKLIFSEFTFIYFLTLLFHSYAYFPFEKKKLIKKRIWLIYPYYVATFYLIALTVIAYTEWKVYLGDIQQYFQIAILIYYFILFLINREKKTKDYKYGRAISFAYLINAFSIIYGSILAIKLDLPRFEYIYILLVFIPLSYLYTISKYELLDSLLKFKKNIQYFIISFIINILLISVLFYLIYLYSNLNIELPNLHFTGTSIEVLDNPLKPRMQSIYSKILFLIFSGITFIILHKMRLSIFKYLDNKYHIANINYQSIVEELSEKLQNHTNLESLTEAILEQYKNLVKLNKCGIVIFEKEKRVAYQSHIGLNDKSLKEYILSIEQRLNKIVDEFQGNYHIDYLQDTEFKEILRNCKYEYIFKLRTKGKLLGFVLIGDKLSESRISNQDLYLGNIITRQAVVALENLTLYADLSRQERFKQELIIARDIQLSSLPRELPTIASLDISGTSIPALEVGGDYYDIFIDKDNPNLITAIIGDVSGKGTSAALYMSKIQGVMRTLQEFKLSLRELIIKANELIFDFLSSGSFITAFCIKFDIDNKKVNFTRAGHLPLYYFNKSENKVEVLTPKGLALGLNIDDIFKRNLEEQSLTYNAGDIFVLITDGITEARNSTQKEYEDERLFQIISKYSSFSSSEMINAILEDLKNFTGRTTQFDDITILIIKVKE